MAVQEDQGLEHKLTGKCFPGILQLDKGQAIDESQLSPLIDFVNQRHDCADFRLICLIKAYFAYSNLLSPQTLDSLKNCILNFKYSMAEPGEDGMCYWSENHQILFAACEYLAGHLFTNELFTNSGQRGSKKAERAAELIANWLEQRMLYGFSEWHSNTYYEEDIAPLCVLVDHAPDDAIRKRASIILDLLFLDMALHSFQGTFCPASGRCYQDQKIHPDRADVADILTHAFGWQKTPKENFDYSRLSALFLICKNYRVPRVIVEIARHVPANPLEIRDSMGLNLKEIYREFPNDSKNQQATEKRGLFL